MQKDFVRVKKLPHTSKKYFVLKVQVDSILCVTLSELEKEWSPTHITDLDVDFVLFFFFFVFIHKINNK